MNRLPDLPPDLVERSLDEAERFATVVLGLLSAACSAAKQDIGRLPPGAAKSPKAERQLFPAMVRLRMHQLIEGHNKRMLGLNSAPLVRKHIRNGAVCLLHQGNDFRLLKDSSRHPTRPSGCYQEALINQEQYWEAITGQGRLFTFAKSLLNGLIYYQVRDYELSGAFVVIPNGFTDQGKVINAAKRPIKIVEDLEELAQFDAGFVDFRSANEDMVIATGDVPVLGGVDLDDPYAYTNPYVAEIIDDLVIGMICEDEGSVNGSDEIK